MSPAGDQHPPRPVPVSPLLAPPPDCAALVFDCDGTLAATLGLHERAFARGFAADGIEMAPEFYRSRAAISAADLFDAMDVQLGRACARDLVMAVSERAFVELLDLVEPNEPVLDVVSAYHGRLPLAVAYGGPRSKVLPTLARLGILDRFETVVTADDVPVGKPAPDLYLAASHRLGIPARHCFAYEDTDGGLASARAAGMRAVDVRPALVSGQV